MKAIVVIDDITEQAFTEEISIQYQLISYPDGYLKYCGRIGKQRLKPMPEKKLDWNDGEDEYVLGWNDCLDEILGK